MVNPRNRATITGWDRFFPDAHLGSLTPIPISDIASHKPRSKLKDIYTSLGRTTVVLGQSLSPIKTSWSPCVQETPQLSVDHVPAIPESPCTGYSPARPFLATGGFEQNLEANPVQVQQSSPQYKATGPAMNTSSSRLSDIIVGYASTCSRKWTVQRGHLAGLILGPGSWPP